MPGSLDEARPRLDRARTSAKAQRPADEHLRVPDEPFLQLIASLTKPSSESLGLLLGALDEHWSLAELATLVYAVPEGQVGWPPDAAPTTELTTLQRASLGLLYKLLAGPRHGTSAAHVAARRWTNWVEHFWARAL